MKKTIYYEDEQNDDFDYSKGKITPRRIDETYKYSHKSPFWKILEFMFYRLLATPVVYLIMKIGFGLKIKNRKALR